MSIFYFEVELSFLRIEKKFPVDDQIKERIVPIDGAI